MKQPLLDPEVLDELVRGRRTQDGKRVHDRRKQLRLTQPQLAELAGVQVSSISRIESGVYTPRDDTKLAIAASLGQEVADLWQPITVSEVRNLAEALVA